MLGSAVNLLSYKFNVLSTERLPNVLGIEERLFEFKYSDSNAERLPKDSGRDASLL